jgi:Flp pilus assembly protein CpaB
MFSRKPLILAIAALILVSIASYILISQSQAKRTVLVAKANIERGTIISEDDVIEKSLMVVDLIDNVIKNKKDVIGKTAKISRVIGDQITKDVISDEEVGYKEVSKEGNVIFSINIPFDDGISKIIKKGDIISIIATKPPSLELSYQSKDKNSSNPCKNCSKEYISRNLVAQRVKVIDMVEKEEKEESVLIEGESYGLTILIEIDRKTAEQLAEIEANNAYKIVLEKGE